MPKNNPCKAPRTGQEITLKEYQALLRSDLATFIQRSFAELNPTTRLLWAAYLDVIVAKLEACRRGEIKRLVINVPPRYLKSHCVTIAFVAWLLGQDPLAQIICVSYAQNLADKHARDCRALMSSPFYRQLFPDTRLSADKLAVADFETTRRGCRMATSVGGVLTGRGGDFLILDDPQNPLEALSEAERARTNGWFDGTLLSRLNNKRTGCIIVVMQRLHEDDLVGHLLEKGGWDVVKFPAIAEADEVFLFDTPFGPKRSIRRQGEALNPELQSLEELEKEKREVGEYNFAAQYQQEPAPLGGGLIKATWFRSYDVLPDASDQIVQSWDTASKATEFSDYSVCTTWVIKGKNAYLRHVFRHRLEYPELKRAVIAQAQAFGATAVVIEDKASGIQLIQDLIADGFYAVVRYQPQGDKIMRLYTRAAMIENGFIFLPREASWRDVYLQELTTFPNARHDDQADSTSQFLDWFGGSNRYTGLIEYTKMEAAKLLAPAPVATARMKAPPYSITWEGPWGRRTLAPGEIVDMPLASVVSLLRGGWIRVA